LTRTKGLKGEQYCMLLVDDYTIMIVVFFLNKKSEAFKNFMIFKEMVETETELKIKCRISDNGEEFTSKEFMEFCSEHKIKRQFLVAKEAQQNGVVKRKTRTI
jgi:transposase InsO family protein